jgi:hypothetical protein
LSGRGENSKDPFEPIVDILAYFAAARKYSYVDALQGALNPDTAKIVIADAIRDFEVACGRGRRRSSEEGVICPAVDPAELDNAVKLLDRLLQKPSARFYQLIRSLTLRALGRASKFRIGAETPGGQSSRR